MKIISKKITNQIINFLQCITDLPFSVVLFFINEVDFVQNNSLRQTSSNFMFPRRLKEHAPVGSNGHPDVTR